MTGCEQYSSFDAHPNPAGAQPDAAMQAALQEAKRKQPADGCAEAGRAAHRRRTEKSEAGAPG
eukprot:8824539-Lingulodinium_polyedra.AAC.1